MNIGIIVEGQEEQQALRYIVSKLNIAGKTFLTPIFASMQPKATSQQIVKAAESKLKILSRADRVIVLIDLENLDVCPGERATEIETVFRGRGFTNVRVVIKRHQFENWLIADPDAINKLRNFTVTEAFKRLVKNSDNVSDPVNLLTRIKNDRKSFHKTNDGTAIAKEIDIDKVASNSRSFRRFLRIIDYPSYIGQSKRAAE